MRVATFFDQGQIQFIARHHDGSQSARQIAKVQRRHLLQTRHLAESDIVREQPRLQQFRHAHEARVRLEVGVINGIVDRQFHFAGALELVQNLKAAPAPEFVARRIALLVRQTHPPARVTIGGAFQATVAPLIFKLIPQSVRLWGLKKYYRM